MDKEEIKDWLSKTGKDRTWLADQIGCTPGTLNQWFSKLGFPEWACKSLQRLMNPTGGSSTALEVSFTASEFERIEAARKLLGLPSRKDYYETAISEFTSDILDREAAANIQATPITAAGRPLILYSADTPAPAKVAEPSAAEALAKAATASTAADHLVKAAQMFDAAHPLTPPTAPAASRSVPAPPPASSPRPKP